MKYSLKKLNSLSGNGASIYAILIEGETVTSLEKFIAENSISFISETKDIVQRLHAIGHKTGARAQFFKENEGRLGDGVCALYDNPGSKLRLYCILYGPQIVVIGGGGHKPKTIRALQEDPKLKAENYFLREVASAIMERIQHKDITFTNDGFDFKGDLEFETEE